jgi:hypothetical protein
MYPGGAVRSDGLDVRVPGAPAARDTIVATTPMDRGEVTLAA